MSDLNKFLDSVKWDENGLVACVAQDHKDNAVLMVAYMNRESLKRTLEEGKMCYWSRSRKKLIARNATSAIKKWQ